MGISTAKSIRSSDLGYALIETAYAEYGSAIEMIAAARAATGPKLRSGYLRHAVDEYNHVKSLLKILTIEAECAPSKVKTIPRFTRSKAYVKGYLEKNALLVDVKSTKRFVEFVYSNELLAKESFERLLESLTSPESKQILLGIMDDELRHHGYAEKYYLSSYTTHQLRLAFESERAKNRIRNLIAANKALLDKLFYPLSVLFTAAALFVLNMLPERQSSLGNHFQAHPTSIL